MIVLVLFVYLTHAGENLYKSFSQQNKNNKLKQKVACRTTIGMEVFVVKIILVTKYF